MPTPTNPSENLSTYFINPEEAAETARLLQQDRSITKEMGSLFPVSLDLSHIHTVLDLACGPGGWAFDVARAYPQIDVVGVDLSEKMMRYAQAHSRVQSLDNASFQVMDVLKPLAFPDEAFDFVNARLLSSFMPTTAWPNLVRECLRITRPGGVIRLTEAEWVFSNGSASERFANLLTHAMWLDGKSFAPDGKRFGATLMISQFLRDAGLINVRRQAYALEYSYGTEAHETWYQDAMAWCQLLLPFLLRMGVTTQEEFDHIYQQIGVEMQEPEFRGLFFLLSARGEKPEG